MSTGLQLWDGSGRLIFDSGSAVVCILGTVILGGDGQPYSGNIFDARLNSGGRPFYQVHFSEANPLAAFSPLQIVSFSGQYLYYEFFNNGNQPSRTKLVYGLI
jgi:hypothetical protein